MNVIIHLPARFVGKVAPSFCRYGYGAMQHREAPAEHSEHLHLVNFALPFAWTDITPQGLPLSLQASLPPLPLKQRSLDYAAFLIRPNETRTMKFWRLITGKPYYPHFLCSNMLNYMHLHTIWQW